MKEQLRRPVKEVIGEFPAVGTVLDEFDIGCFPCAVGTCLLGDVVSIHGLSPERGEELMRRLADVVADRASSLAAPTRPRGESQRTFTYSAPVQRLVDEHTLIKRLIALVPKLAERLDVESDAGRRLVVESIFFIRTYADAFHHAKEEDILFGYTDSSQEVIQVMLEDHTQARIHVRALVAGLRERDAAAVREHLLAYAELLTEHIKREDEILYPWMDRALAPAQVEQLSQRFDAADAKADTAAIERCRRFVEELEATL